MINHAIEIKKNINKKCLLWFLSDKLSFDSKTLLETDSNKKVAFQTARDNLVNTIKIVAYSVCYDHPADQDEDYRYLMDYAKKIAIITQ